MQNNSSASEINLDPPCQFCGCASGFKTTVVDLRRKIPLYRCCQCGRGRDDLMSSAGLAEQGRVLTT